MNAGIWRAARVGLTLLLVGGCRDTPSVDAAPPGPPPKPVRIEAVGLSPVASELSVPGIVEARSRVPLAFRIDGFVEDLIVEEGARVESGAPVARLDLRDAQREVALARAELESAAARATDARLEFDRQRRLLDARSISRQRFEKTKAALEVANAEERSSRVRLGAAKDRMEDCTLVAPFPGHVEKHLVEEHEFTGAGTPVLILLDLETVVVRAEAPQGKLPLLRSEAPAIVRSSAWPGREFRGTVRSVSVAADPATRTVPFEVTLENSDLSLRPEMLVEVSVRDRDRTTVHTVPLGAVLRDASLEPFCFLVPDAEGEPRVERRGVALGPVVGERVSILEGLATGERVVVRGQHFLRDGDPVRVLED